MATSIITTVYDWLREMKIPVSKAFIKQKLLSHPDYPSLLSITDTLDELGIYNTAVQIGKEELSEIPTPFIAHLNGSFGEFVTIKNKDSLDQQFPKFFSFWDGVVVVAEKTENWQYEQNSEWMNKETVKQKIGLVTFSILAVFIFLSIVISFSWVQAVLMLIAITGVFVSWLIVSQDIGIENRIADQICGKDADCNSVIHSDVVNFPLGIGWSDAGIVYFPFLLIALIINSFISTPGNNYQLFAVLALAAIPVTLVSIYYQWTVIKKWCRLCLITVSLLWIQFTILLPEILNIFQNGFDQVTFNDFALLGFLLFVTAAVWLWLKSLLKENKETREGNFANLRLKSKTEVFNALLYKEKKIDITPFENDLQIGNADADLQIMVACNPYCGPCAKTHKVLHELVEQNDVGLTIRFLVKPGNNKAIKLQAAEYILQVVTYEPPKFKRKAMKDWYDLMDLESFKKRYPINGSRRMRLIGEMSTLISVPDSEKNKMGLALHEKWTRESDIAYTPAIFVNGFQLPRLYEAADLKMIARVIKNNDATFEDKRKRVLDLS